MSSDSLDIRPLRDGDLHGVMRLADEVYGVGFEEPAALAAKVAAGVTFVATIHGALAGYGVALPWRGLLPNLQARPPAPVDAPAYLFVHDICVADSARGRGVGPALMRRIEEEAGRRGLDELHCVAVHGAEAVWARLGWVPSDRPRPDDYPADGVPMTRRLTGGTR